MPTTYSLRPSWTLWYSARVAFSLWYLYGLVRAFVRVIMAWQSGAIASIPVGWFIGLVFLFVLLWVLFSPVRLSMTEGALRIHSLGRMEVIPFELIHGVEVSAPGPVTVDRYAYRFGLSNRQTAFAKAPSGLVLVQVGITLMGLHLSDPDRFVMDLRASLGGQDLS